MRERQSYKSLWSYLGLGFVTYIKWLAHPSVDRDGDTDGELIFGKVLSTVVLLALTFLAMLVACATDGLILLIAAALLTLVDFLRYLGHFLNQAEGSDEEGQHRG